MLQSPLDHLHPPRALRSVAQSHIFFVGGSATPENRLPCRVFFTSPAFDVVGRKPPAISPRNLFFRRTAFGAGTTALQPSEKLLFASEHVASFVAQLAHNPIARLGKPREAMRLASILFFVGAFAAPIEDGGAALFPIAHGVPVARFVGTQALMSAEAGVAPELGDLVEAGINSRGDALPFRVAG